MINNITVGASFGATRSLTFKHHATGDEVSFAQHNGDIFAFDDFVDSNYMHGLYPVKGQDLGPRVSVIIMGRRKAQTQVTVCPFSEFAQLMGGRLPSGPPCGSCSGCVRVKRGR
mmetsp:Transcript_92366/g.214642  ORF Transcript_92366/g.214642 Transcript_92366/m.214642 type:complete len:114 (+) Transcript_92366:365-706(+)